ncbi:MAG: hypothetical protein IJA12_07255 [Oscillospiraceae bacterium]|nr:hypothetical protein [Oscillospiraceae bacterium]
MKTKSVEEMLGLLDYSGKIILVGINYTTDPDTDYKKHTCKIERITG